MSTTEKTKATIDVLQSLEATARVAGRAKDPVIRLAAAELEIELSKRRHELEQALSQDKHAA